MTRLYDCSLRQEQDWETNLQAEPEILTGAIFVTDFQSDKMEQAFAWLVAKHESLRTVFIHHQGKLYQRVLDGDRTEGFYLRYVSTSPVDGSRSQGSPRQHLHDLSKSPLFFLLVRPHEDGSATLFIFIHHIIADYWSVWTLKNDLLTAYNGLLSGNCKSLKPLPLQLKDYIKIKNEKSHAQEARHHAYWREKLQVSFLHRMQQLLWNRLHNRDEDPFLRTEGSGKYVLYLDQAAYLLILQTAGRLSVSIPAIFFAGFALSLSEYFSTSEVIFSSVVSDRSDKDSADLIAHMVGGIHMRINLDIASGYDAFIKKIYMEFLRSCRYPIYNYGFLPDQELREANLLHLTYIHAKDEPSGFWMEEPGHNAVHSTHYPLSCIIFTDAGHCKLEIYYHGSFFCPADVDVIINLLRRELARLTEPEC